MLLSAMSTQLLNTSRERNSTTVLHSLFQCLTTVSTKKFFSFFNLNLPWSNLRPFLQVLLLVTWEKKPTLLLIPFFWKVGGEPVEKHIRALFRLVTVSPGPQVSLKDPRTKFLALLGRLVLRHLLHLLGAPRVQVALRDSLESRVLICCRTSFDDLFSPEHGNSCLRLKVCQGVILSALFSLLLWLEWRLSYTGKK